MQESFSSEHGSELIADTLKEFLDGSRVADKGGRHLQTTWWDRAKSGLNVVGDPLDEIAAVLVLNIAHLILNLLHADLATEDGRASEVSAVAEVRSSHHVLGVEHLLGEFWDGDGTEGVSTTARKRSEADHEEVKTREGNHVDGKFSQVRVELTRETQASGDTRHDCRDKVVQVAIGRVGQLEGTHADVVESLYMLGFALRSPIPSSYLIVNAEGLIRVLDQLVDGESGVVWLNDGVGNLGRWDDGEGGHHSIGEFLSNLGDQQRTHTCTGTTTERVGDLKALKAIAALGLTSNNIENLVNKFGTLGVVTLGPVVACRTVLFCLLCIPM